MSAKWSGFTAGGYGWKSWRDKTVENKAGTIWDGWYPYDNQHAWIAEMEQAYYHTGDRLFRDNLDNLGELFQGSLKRWRETDPTHSWMAPRALAWCMELVRTQFTLTADSSALESMTAAAQSFALANQDGVIGCLNARDRQAFPNGMIAHHFLNFYRELPEGKLKRQIFGSLVGLGDYFTRHSWAADNRGIGQMIENHVAPYYQNDDMGDMVAMLYVMTGQTQYRDKAKIISNLSAWWHAATYDPMAFTEKGSTKTSILIQGTGIQAHSIVVRSFDAMSDEANMSLPSNAAVPKCCFNPDTLELPAKLKSPRMKRRGLGSFHPEAFKDALGRTQKNSGTPRWVPGTLMFGK
jgi:hypothetical protein